MRTQWKVNNTTNDFFVAISIISIILSIMSINNAILCNENGEMTIPKWKMYKMRCPPSCEFLHHSLWRLSEIIYRIGLLSLIWTVCDGYIFLSIIGYELILLTIMTILEITGSIHNYSIFDILLRLQTLIILPSSLIYQYEVSDDPNFKGTMTYLCCLSPDDCPCCNIDDDENDNLGSSVELRVRDGRNYNYRHHSIGSMILSWFIKPIISVCDCDCWFNSILCICCCYGLCVRATTIEIYDACCCFLFYNYNYNDRKNETRKCLVANCSSAEYNYKGKFHYFIPSARLGISFVEWIFLILYGLFGDDDGNRFVYLINVNYGLVVFIISLNMYIIYVRYMDLFPKFGLPKGVSSSSEKGLAFNGELEELQLRRLGKNDNIKKDNNGLEILMFALSNEQYHVVEWLAKEMKIDWKAEIERCNDLLLVIGEDITNPVIRELLYFKVARHRLGIQYWSDEEIPRPKEINYDRRVNHKLLMLGIGNAGKSTFLKQFVVIHKGELEKDEIVHGVRYIHDAAIVQMKAILNFCLEELKYSLETVSIQPAEELDDLAPDASKEDIGRLIEILWNDPAIKKAFENRRNLGIVDSCPHFFDDCKRIFSDDYIPTEQDILLARIPTTGIRVIEFEVKGNRFSVFDTGGERSERLKWIDCFDSVHAVLYIASLIDYDQYLYEENEKNAMYESIECFECVVRSKYFRQSAIILLLNKSDLFKIKIEKKPLTVCFAEYKDENVFDAAIEFIKMKYKEKVPDKDRRGCYVHVTCAVDRYNVTKVFDDIQHGVLMRQLLRSNVV